MMASDMMRIAGRNGDGKSRAITVDKYDNLKTSMTSEIQLFNEQKTIGANEELETDLINGKGFTTGQLQIMIHQDNRQVLVYIQRYRETGDLTVEVGDYELLHRTKSSRHTSYTDFSLPDLFKLKIKNISNLGLSINTQSKIIMSNDNQRKDDYNIEYLSEQPDTFSLNSDESFITNILLGDDYNNGQLKIIGNNKRKFEVFIKRYKYDEDRGSVVTQTDYESIYKSENEEYEHLVEFVPSTYYKLKIKNISEYGVSISSEDFVIIKTNKTREACDPKDNELYEELRLIKDSLEEVSWASKKPSTHLNFVRTEISNFEWACIGQHDDNIYVLTNDGKIEVYEDVESNEPTEIGEMELDVVNNKVKSMYSSHEGLVFFVKKDNKATILHSKDINTSPEQVYQSAVDDTTFVYGFGTDSYSNGLKTFYLAGVYGSGDERKELLFSKDGGSSFKKIKETVGIEEGVNSHWHDVAIDTYNGFLWASEGDGETNRAVHYSMDFGVTWKLLTTESQPTSINPLPTRVVFGRDDARPGLSYIDVPKKYEEFESLGDSSYKNLIEFKVDVQGYAYYANKGLIRDNEVYINFFAYDDNSPYLILGSGDFGLSWHSVFMGGFGSSVSRFIGIDNNYIYGAVDFEGIRTLVFSNRIEWEG